MSQFPSTGGWFNQWAMPGSAPPDPTGFWGGPSTPSGGRQNATVLTPSNPFGSSGPTPPSFNPGGGGTQMFLQQGPTPNLTGYSAGGTLQPTGQQMMSSNPFMQGSGGRQAPPMPRPAQALQETRPGGTVNGAPFNLDAFARSMGLVNMGNGTFQGRLAGSNGSLVGPSVTYRQTDIEAMARRAQQQGAADQRLGTMNNAMVRDTRATQDAADRQHANVAGAHQQYAQFVQGIPGQVLGPANAQVAQLLGTAADMERQGLAMQQPFTELAQQALRGAGIDLSRVYAALDRGYNAASSMVSTYTGNMSSYMSSVATGIQANARDAVRQVMSGMNPDGTQMTPQQQQEAYFRVQGDVRRQVNEAIAPLQAQAEQYRAQLFGRMSELNAGMAGTELSAAVAQQQAGAAGIAQAGQLLGYGAQIFQRQAEMAAQFRNYASQVASAAVLNTVNLQMQGFGNLASMIASNPETIVGTLHGLLAMESVRRGMEPRWGAAARSSNQTLEEGMNIADFLGGGGEEQGGARRPAGTQAPTGNTNPWIRQPGTSPNAPEGPPRQGTGSNPIRRSTDTLAGPPEPARPAVQWTTGPGNVPVPVPSRGRPVVGPGNVPFFVPER